MEKIDLLLSPRWIVPIRPRNLFLEDHSIAVQNGKILSILPTADALAKFSPATHKKLPRHVMMPGLVNAHTHSPMTLYRGLADDLKLMDWLQNHIWPAEGELTCADSIRAGMHLACADMIRGGTTCFNDMYFFPNESALAVIDSGLRACLGHTIMNVPTGWAQDENEYIYKAREAHQSRPQNDLITFSIAPHAPYTNSDRSLKMSLELAHEFDAIINMHIHEAKHESSLMRLNELGILCDKLVAIHMVHLSPDEIALCAEKKINIVHCPVSNLKLASGFSPIKEIIEAGINLAIGTDGAASNNSLDLFAETKTAAIVAKAKADDPTVMPAFTALEMATINGAKALHLQDKIGSLEPGKCADMIAITLDDYFTQPIYNPISHLVYAVNRLQVSDVWVNGKCLLDNGELQTLDPEKIVAAVKPWHERAKKYAYLSN
jgi:5-methylthioadenosine/S-adenosylhomocysteine deaminase